MQRGRRRSDRIQPVLFLGDWQQYVVLDRIGTSVYFLPPGVLTNTNANLPDGRAAGSLSGAAVPNR